MTTPYQIKNTPYVNLDLAVKHQEELGSYDNAIANLHRLETIQPQTDIIIGRKKALAAKINAAILNGSWSDNLTRVDDERVNKDDVPFIHWGYQSVHGISSPVTTGMARTSDVIYFLLDKVPWFHVHSASITALLSGYAVAYHQVDTVERGLVPFICSEEVAEGCDGFYLTLSRDGQTVNYMNTVTKNSARFDLAVYDAMLHLAAFAQGAELRALTYKGIGDSKNLDSNLFYDEGENGTKIYLATIDANAWDDKANLLEPMGDKFFGHSILKLSSSLIQNGNAPINPKSIAWIERLTSLREMPMSNNSVLGEGSSSLKDYVVDGLGKIKNIDGIYAKSILTANNFKWTFN